MTKKTKETCFGGKNTKIVTIQIKFYNRKHYLKGLYLLYKQEFRAANKWSKVIVHQYESSCSTRYIPIIHWVKKLIIQVKKTTWHSKKRRTNCHVTKAGFSLHKQMSHVITSCLNFWGNPFVCILAEKGKQILTESVFCFKKGWKAFALKSFSNFPKSESLLSNRVGLFLLWWLESTILWLKVEDLYNSVVPPLLRMQI